MQFPLITTRFTGVRGGALWPAVLLAAALVSGCATTPEEIPALQTAEAEFDEAQSKPRIDAFGRRGMRAAERHLEQARTLAEEGGDRDAIEHHAFLARHYVQIAESRLGRGLTQEQIATADKRRQELMLAAEQRQSSAAQQRAEEAEARLALTQEELEQTREAAQTLAAELDDLKVRQDERGTIFTLSDVVFDLDSAKLKPGGERTLSQVAATLKEYPQTRILVEGFTDATGSDAYNANLSERRARSVKSELVQAGIPETRIEIEGHGEQFPVASNDTPQGRQLNRRVEIVVSDGPEPVERRGS